MPSDVMTREQAAERLGVSFNTIRRWEQLGKLSVIRYGRNCIRLLAAEVEQLALSRSS